MKFDPKKPYGVITNHEWARYEQNGILYNNQGQPMDKLLTTEELDSMDTSKSLVGRVIRIEEENPERDFALEQAKDFLENILSSGALARSAIFKEAEANNQDWEKIKTAFANMGGEVLTRRNVIHWKLKTS